MAKSAESEKEIAKFVKGKCCNSNKGGPEVGSVPKDNELEEHKLCMQNEGEEGRHEHESKSVPKEKSDKEEDSKPVEKDCEEFLHEVGFKNEGWDVNEGNRV